MEFKRHKPEDIVTQLRQVEPAVRQGNAPHGRLLCSRLPVGNGTIRVKQNLDPTIVILAPALPLKKLQTLQIFGTIQHVPNRHSKRIRFQQANQHSVSSMMRQEFEVSPQ